MAVKETIAAASIARVTNKAGKLLGFLVKSNSSNDYYQVTVTRIAGEHVFTCTCKAGQFGFRNCKDGLCCHCKAILEVCEARKQAATMANFFQALSEFAGKAAAIAQRDAEHAAWNIEHGYAADAFSSRINTGKYAIAKTDYHPDFNQPAQAERIQKEAQAIVSARFAELEQQRAEAKKYGGFSILA